MALNTGKVAITLEFDTGDKEVVFINPTDYSIAERIAEIPNKIKGFIADSEENEKKFTEARKALFDATDYAFACPGFSEKVFSHCDAFAVVGDGKLFYEEVIEYLLEKIAAEAKKAQAKMDKHLAKYRK